MRNYSKFRRRVILDAVFFLLHSEQKNCLLEWTKYFLISTKFFYFNSPNYLFGKIN